MLCTVVVTPMVLHGLGTAGFKCLGAATSLSMGDRTGGHWRQLRAGDAGGAVHGAGAAGRRAAKIGGGLARASAVAAVLLLACAAVWLCGGLRQNQGVLCLIALATLALNVPSHSGANIFWRCRRATGPPVGAGQTLLTAGGWRRQRC